MNPSELLKLSNLISLLKLPFNTADVLNFKIELQTEEGDQYKIWLKNGRRFLISFSPLRPSPWITIEATGYWSCKDGTIILISEMSDIHYQNTVSLLVKKLKENPIDWKLKFHLAAFQRDSRFPFQECEDDEDDESKYIGDYC